MWALLALTALLFAMPEHVGAQSISSSGAAGPAVPDDCVTQAAAYHDVNSWIIRATLKIESNFNASAINRNRNGTVDVGIAQVNSIHFKELASHGITPQDLRDACISSYLAAWHMKKQVRAYGNTWFAIGAYHSTTPCLNRRRVAQVWNILLDWKVVEGSRLTVANMKQCDVSIGKSQGSTAQISSREEMLSYDN